METCTETAMKLYLAHPILSREDIRNKELAFEQRTGIELVNPFYDGDEAEVIKKLDSEKMTLQEYAAYLNEKGHGKEFVLDDLKAIDKYDGVVAVIYRGTPTIGTSMEAMWAVVPALLKLLGFETNKPLKPVYVVTNFPEHIWLIMAAKRSGGFIVETWSELEERLMKIKEKEEKKNDS